MRFYSRKSKRNEKKRGGNYNYTNYVYGQNHTAAPNGNEIAVVGDPKNYGTVTKGGSVLTDVAVPGVLLYANNFFGSRSKYGKNSKRRQTRRRRTRSRSRK
jgi:hypothetical protein